MQALDRLGWADGFAVTAYGRPIGVRVTDPAMLPLVLDRLPPGARPSGARTVERLYSIVGGGESDGRLRRFNLLYGDNDRMVRTMDMPVLLDALESSLRDFVAEFARTRVFFHAGVVGWRGRAIVIPGPSLSGKSSLVAALVRAGARYYSDDWAPIDSHGRVHPFPKPLELRDERGVQRPISTGGGDVKAGSAPLRAGLVVLTSYKEGARWRPRPLTPGQAALELMRNAPAARGEQQRVLDAATGLALAAPAVRGNRGEADRAAEAILAYFQREIG